LERVPAVVENKPDLKSMKDDWKRVFTFDKCSVSRSERRVISPSPPDPPPPLDFELRISNLMPANLVFSTSWRDDQLISKFAI
jgi:hypothetical protein